MTPCGIHWVQEAPRTDPSDFKASCWQHLHYETALCSLESEGSDYQANP